MYTAKDFKQLIGMEGFSEKLLTNHFKLYEGYVTNVNKASEFLKTAEQGTQQFAETKRRFGWEFNGMRLHEFYFENLSKSSSTLDVKSSLAKQLILDFGSIENWEKDFRASCAMRGIGWVVLAYDTVAKKLFNLWINEHDVGLLAGATLILVADVYEHAYVTDYGIVRADYINAFMKQINWKEVQKRFV
jgi:Fe-Mn family superoxide dismutase